MIGRALMKIFRDQATFCLFLTPAWISLPILPLLKNALISNPVFIPSSHILGNFPNRYAFPLMAWPISSPYASEKVIPRKFQLPSSKESPQTLQTYSMLWAGFVGWLNKGKHSPSLCSKLICEYVLFKFKSGCSTT